MKLINNNGNKLVVALILAFSFVMVNCQKASNRSVKARNNSNNKAGENPANFPPCGEKVLPLLQSRLEVRTEMTKLIAEAGEKELDAEQKNKLQKLAVDLKTVSDALAKEISSLKQGTMQAQGCNTPDPQKPNAKLAHSLAKMKLDDVTLAKKAAAVTKEANPFDEQPKDQKQPGDSDDNTSPDGSDKDQNNVDPVADKTKLIEKQKYTLSAELADMLGEESANNKMYILEGKVHSSATAADEIKALRDKKEKAFCTLQLGVAKLKENDEMQIQSINKKMDADQKTAKAQVVFVAGPEKDMYSLVCLLPNSSDANKELRLVLGGLIK